MLVIDSLHIKQTMTIGYKKKIKGDGGEYESVIPIPARIFWTILGTLIAGGALGDHAVTSLFPMRGHEEVKQFQDKTTADNLSLIHI